MRQLHNKKPGIAIIGTVGVPAQYGGFETLAHHLVGQLSGDFDLTVYCSGRHYKAGKRPASWQGANLVYLPFKANGVQSIIYDILSIFHALFFADTLLILGVSGCIVLPFVKLFTRKKIVVNIDGLEWRRAKWNSWAKAFLSFNEVIAVHFSDEVITDNKAIQDYVYQHHGVQTSMVAYGGDHAAPQPMSKTLLRQYPFLATNYAFKVCRIEPENNIELILAAFAGQSTPLVLVGNWENSHFGRKLKQKYSQYRHLHLLNPIYDQQKLNEIRSNGMIYVHGHSAGGTNPSLVEAMCLGLPVLAYDVIYNRETTHQQALYFDSKDALASLLQTSNAAQLDSLGKRMKQLAGQHYRWKTIASQYAMLMAPELSVTAIPSLK
jgi:glycosyltransferase involved in cell wall biosynthesis